MWKFKIMFEDIYESEESEAIHVVLKWVKGVLNVS